MVCLATHLQSFDSLYVSYPAQICESPSVILCILLTAASISKQVESLERRE
jgi:hypothetical protein